jgi:hypothetical protein
MTGARMTEGRAKRFFVGKVLAEAELEGVSLSAAEREMLTWSESGMELKTDPTLPSDRGHSVPGSQPESK